MSSLSPPILNGEKENFELSFYVCIIRSSNKDFDVVPTQ